MTLHNWQSLCPSLAPILVNTYRSNAELCVAGETILSCEGTTQGDPLAMAMYTLGTLPLLRTISTPGAYQTWYADDASAGGKLLHVRSWWDQLLCHGPDFGYHVNSKKSWLIVKDPTTLSEEYTFSLQLSAPLIALIIQQSDDLGDYGEQHEGGFAE